MPAGVQEELYICCSLLALSLPLLPVSWTLSMAALMTLHYTKCSRSFLSLSVQDFLLYPYHHMHPFLHLSDSVACIPRRTCCVNLAELILPWVAATNTVHQAYICVCTHSSVSHTQSWNTSSFCCLMCKNIQNEY